MCGDCQEPEARPPLQVWSRLTEFSKIRKSVANSCASAPLRFEVYAINKEGESPPVQVGSAPVAKHKDYFQASILNNLLVRLAIQECYQLLRILILVWASEGGGPVQAAKRAEGAG